MRHSPPGSAANRPSLGCAPGRVELLGNHTDYNGGLVMAAAIDRSTVVVGRRCAGRDAPGRLGSTSTQTDACSLDAIERTEAGAWTRYVRGVCWALSEWRGPLASGFEASDRRRRAPRGGSFQLGEPPGRVRLVPDPARVSCRADRAATSEAIAPTCIAWNWPRCCGGRRMSSWGWLGLARPVLQPVRPCQPRALLDCDTLDSRPACRWANPAPAIVVCDSKTSRRLADGMYDHRRAECETVVADVPGTGSPTRGEFRSHG